MQSKYGEELLTGHQPSPCEKMKVQPGPQRTAQNQILRCGFSGHRLIRVSVQDLGATSVRGVTSNYCTLNSFVPASASVGMD